MKYKTINIEEIETRYYITKTGQVYNKITNQLCKHGLDSKGYERVWISLYNKHLRVHRLVMAKYLPCEDMEYVQVNHIDCNKCNNNIENLEWVTNSENQIHAYKNNLISRKGEKNSQNKLTEKEVKLIINDLLNSVPMAKIALIYGISESTIGAIRTKRLWKHLSENIDFPKSKYDNRQKNNIY